MDKIIITDPRVLELVEERLRQIRRLGEDVAPEDLITNGIIRSLRKKIQFKKYGMQRKFLFRQLWREQPHHCYYCLRFLSEKIATLDHKMPIARSCFDTTDVKNLVLSCQECNVAKGLFTDKEFLKLKEAGLI